MRAVTWTIPPLPSCSWVRHASPSPVGPVSSSCLTRTALSNCSVASHEAGRRKGGSTGAAAARTSAWRLSMRCPPSPPSLAVHASSRGGQRAQGRTWHSRASVALRPAGMLGVSHQGRVGRTTPARTEPHSRSDRRGAAAPGDGHERAGLHLLRPHAATVHTAAAPALIRCPHQPRHARTNTQAHKYRDTHLRHGLETALAPWRQGRRAQGPGTSQEGHVTAEPPPQRAYPHPPPRSMSGAPVVRLQRLRRRTRQAAAVAAATAPFRHHWRRPHQRWGLRHARCCCPTCQLRCRPVQSAAARHHRPIARVCPQATWRHGVDASRLLLHRH
jgi:hypothetical protein